MAAIGGFNITYVTTGSIQDWPWVDYAIPKPIDRRIKITRSGRKITTPKGTMPVVHDINFIVSLPDYFNKEIFHPPKN